ALVYAMRHVYGSNPGEAFFASSDFGWAVGHSLTCYGALMNRNETVVYEGKPVGTPDPGAFFRVLSEYNVKVFFTSPTALMILRKEDNDAKYRRKYDLSHVRGLFLAGERCVPEIHRWWIDYITNNNPTATSAACSNSHDIARAPEFSFAYMDGSPTNPVVNVSTDHWWQTESGSPLTAICLGDITTGADIPPIRFGSAGMALPGVDLRILRTHSDDGDEDDTSPKSTDHALEEAAPGEIGSVVIKLPLPPGCFSGLWKNDKKFFTEYFERFPGYYATGDAGFVDADGYVFILSRDDDVINVAAHRLSTSTVEETATRHPTVAECCVVPRPHNIKGQVPVVFAVLKSGSYTPSQLADAKSQIAAAVRSNIGAIVSLLPENIFFVEKLPKTRSGKILRKLLRNMFTAIADHTADTNRGSSRLSTTVIPLDLPATMEDFAVAYDIWKQLLDTPHVYSKL
ncbi:Acyl-CoA synthetase short-chain family member 3, mitochondrial, partial [Zancudomyces culisetae]